MITLRKITVLPIFILINFFAAPTFAQNTCDDLWFSRNFYANKYGHCFQSNLGKSVFDSSDCKQSNLDVPSDIHKKIMQIEALEIENGCYINSQIARDLEILNISNRLKLSIQPLSDGLESLCQLNKKNGALFYGLSQDSDVAGQVFQGDLLVINHGIDVLEEDTNWTFIDEVIRDNRRLSIQGWAPPDILSACLILAG